MFHRILVGIDDSPAAKAALARAVELVEAGPRPARIAEQRTRPTPCPLRRTDDAADQPGSARPAADRLGAAQRGGSRKAGARGDPGDQDRPRAARPAGRCCARPAPGCWDLVIVGQAHRRHRPLLERVGERLNRHSDDAGAGRPRGAARARAATAPLAAAPARAGAHRLAADRRVHELPVAGRRGGVGKRAIHAPPSGPFTDSATGTAAGATTRAPPPIRRLPLGHLAGGAALGVTASFAVRVSTRVTFLT